MLVLPWVHELAAHFAVGLLLTGLLFDVLGLFRKMESLLYVGFWNTFLGMIGLFAALASGKLAELGLGPHSNLGGAWLPIHKFMAYVVAVCAFIMVASRLVMKGSVVRKARIFYMAVSFFGAVLLVVTGYVGSTLVYAYGLGIERPTAQRVLMSGASATAPASSEKSVKFPASSHR